MKKPRIALVAAAASLIFVICCAYAGDLPKWFPFKQQNSLKEWQEKVFRGRVLYEIKADHARENFLSATSRQACSGLGYRIKFDVKEFPMFRFFMNPKISLLPNLFLTNTTSPTSL